jgi:trehalose-6-phosphatase
VEQQWSVFAEIWGLSLTEFDGGLELRVPGRNKGDAVKEMLVELDQNAAIAYLGDDHSDEDGFKSIPCPEPVEGHNRAIPGGLWRLHYFSLEGGDFWS